MGKRELIIALAFVVVGAVAFRFAAPPAKTTGGLSFTKILDSARREMRSNDTYMAPPRHYAFPIDAGVTELRLESLNGSTRIIGEDRADVSYDLSVASSGDNEAEAIAIANKANLLHDRLGSALTLKIKFPDEERQTASAVLRVPSRLAVRLDGARDAVIDNVRAVDFATAARGATEISKVAEGVRGEQSGGQLTVTAAANLQMTLTRARARLKDVSGATSLDVQGGVTDVADSRGSLEIESRRGEITVRNQRGVVKISGADGHVRVEGAVDDFRADMRRAAIELTYAAAAPATLSTTAEQIRVTLPAAAAVRFDAATSGARIDASDWNLTAEKSGDDSRMDAATSAKNGSLPRISIRNQSADIILRKSSKK